MKYITANTLTYDASVGRVEPGETYYVDDDKAERWIAAGIAKEGKRPAPPPEPEPEGDELEEDDEDDEEEVDETELKAKAKALFEAGNSQRAVAEQLGISRSRVHNLLQD